MRRGRPPDAPELKVLRGTTRPDRDAPAGADGFPRGAPEAPSWLGDRGRFWFGRLVADLGRVPGLLSPADAHLLGVAASMLAKIEHAELELAEGGELVARTAEGGIKGHPLVALQLQATDRLRAVLSEFGMSPAARTHLARRAAREGGGGARGKLGRYIS